MAGSKGRGLSVGEAMRVMAHITSCDENRKAFEANPGKALQSLGIDPTEVMGGCDVDSPIKLPSADTLRAKSDLLTGKFLTAHASQTIHHVVK